MFERTRAESFKNDFASIRGCSERFRLTTLPCSSVLARGPDIRYGGGARDGVCANEFIGHVCLLSLTKAEVPWHDLL